MLKKIKCYDLGFAEVFVFENYLISQINDDVSIGLEHVDDLKKLIDEHYKDEKLVYISNRVSSYTVDPLVYPEIGRIDNLVGVAVITDSQINVDNAMVEKIFYSKEFKVFKSFEDSIRWAAQLIAMKKIKKMIS